MKKFILLVSFLLVSSQVFPTNLFTENFSYTTGSLLNTNGWVSVANPNVTPSFVVAPGLTYSDFNLNDYLGSGIGNAASVGPAGEDDARTLSSPQTSGSLYCSFMLRVTAVQGTGDFNFTLMTTSGANNGRLYARPATGGYNLGLEKATGSGVTYSPNVYSVGTTYLIVVQYIFVTGALNDQMSLYVFSSSDVVPSTPPSPTLGPVTFTLGTDPADLNRVQCRQGSLTNGPTWIIDGIYVETDWNNGVLPVELSSFTSSVNTNNVNLNWSTVSESNNSGFDVERSITNGTWSKVGNVTGNGTKSSASNYSFTDRNVASGNYSYRLKQIDYNGNFEYFNLSNEVNVGVPAEFELSQNYPNPFNPSTQISFALPSDGKVSLKIYDMSGKEAMTLVNEVKTSGYYSVSFNASSLSSGVYFYTISANEFTATKKMMLIK